MTPFEQLTCATRADRQGLQRLPVIRRALEGDITRELYLGFLTQAWHHVRHTVPLLMVVGSRLQARQRWLQHHIVHYLEEEVGHDDRVLNDITVAGGDADRVRRSAPGVATDAMIAYAYDTVMRGEPAGFFGLALVLEGTRVALAPVAANAIQSALKLPDDALTYLRSHSHLGPEHIGEIEAIVNRLDTDREWPAVLACARTMYSLYGNVFRSLDETARAPSAKLASMRSACA